MTTAILLLAIGALVALWLAAKLRAWRGSRRATRRAARAGAGERAAAALLEAAGYRIVAAQQRLVYTPRIDGEPHAIELRADYLVTTAAGERLVAEVKTGDAAPSLDTAATRRQLLEYRVAFAADAVLLVCPETRRIHRVDFPVENLPAATAEPTLDA